MILAFASYVGCTTNVPDRQKESAPVKSVMQTAADGNTLALAPRAPYQTHSKDLGAVVEGNNAFAFDLYRQLAQTPGNICFSPYSISTALSMTYAGARGNTAEEMAQTLHFALDNERLHPMFGELIRNVQGRDRKRNYELAVANSLWGDKGLALDPIFMRITQTDYQAEFQFVDFAGNAGGARKSINAWVEEKTNKKIEDLIPIGLLQSMTRLVLVNCIYFKADWSQPFPKEATKPDDFTLLGGSTIKVPVMKHQIVANYMANTDFQLAELRYKDNEVSMVVILPQRKNGVLEVEKNLSKKSLSEALTLVNAARLEIAMPKFKMTETFSLGSELGKLGMRQAFHREKADFTGMLKHGSPKSVLFISGVVHKVFVDVNEEGTEAAAATGVVVEDIDSELGSPLPFRIDHPFLLLLRHNATGSILLLGRVSDPRDQ